MQRRHFLKSSAGALSFPAIIPATAIGQGDRPAPSNRITLGVIGLGGMGNGDMSQLMREDDVQVVAVCDVHQKVGDKGLEPGKARVEKYYAEKNVADYKGCSHYSDFRELCARKDIDAVVVATPDHWHALATLEALRNGKDVYCEKPVTHLFGEGQAVYKEAAKQKAIFQTGSQQRSSIRFRIAVEAVMNGLIGKVKHVEVGLPKGNGTDELGRVGQPIPEGLDYDMWCGPSRYLPFSTNRLHWNWRWCLDYGGGQLMDWIGHHNDIAHWGLGMDKSGPTKVEAVGFEFPEKGMWDGPTNYEVKCEFAGGCTSLISNKNTMGTKWIGEDGWIYVDRGKIDASNKEWIREKTDRGSIKAYASPGHHRNFVDGIKTRKECIAPAETAHRSITPGHLSYISVQLGRALEWDPAKEEVINDPKADALLKAVNYRGEWSLDA
ncbi:MAG: putative dehydrogenase [Verrucomicrobiales bacterium]|jgi:predicted dehydrogenase